MKIRIATMSSISLDDKCMVWNVRTVDKFVELFVRDHQLVIGELRVQIANFVKHSQYIATFDVENVAMESELVAEGMCPYRYVWLEMTLALARFNASNGRGSFHNVKVDYIPDDFNPLKNPKAEAARRAAQCDV